MLRTRALWTKYIAGNNEAVDDLRGRTRVRSPRRSGRCGSTDRAAGKSALSMGALLGGARCARGGDEDAALHRDLGSRAAGCSRKSRSGSSRRRSGCGQRESATWVGQRQAEAINSQSSKSEAVASWTRRGDRRGRVEDAEREVSTRERAASTCSRRVGLPSERPGAVRAGQLRSWTEAWCRVDQGEDARFRASSLPHAFLPHLSHRPGGSSESAHS